MTRIKKFLRWLFPEPFIFNRGEVITGEDRAYYRQFVTMLECVSVEKHLRLRISEHMQTASNGMKSERERLDAIAKKDELIDLLREWKNLRSDLEEDGE